MTHAEIGWVAGLLEGEGYFCTSWKTSTTGEKYPAFKVSCNMTDLDVLERLRDITGVGILKGPYQGSLHHKPHWRWNVNRREDVTDLIMKILPLMGERRSAKINEMIDVLKRYPGRPKWRHGTVHGYDAKGCRCNECRAANAEKGRRQRHRRKLAS